jgi:hypothetical protein
MLLCDVQGGSRKRQVVRSPRMPNAKTGHLPTSRGMETATGMAPPRRERSGWMSALQIFLATYGFQVSSSHATPSQETDYAGVSEAAGFQPLRSVTEELASYVLI